MKGKANFYFSILVVCVAGVLAIWFIIRLATKDSTPAPTVKGSEASYSNLQQSILKP